MLRIRKPPPPPPPPPPLLLQARCVVADWRHIVLRWCLLAAGHTVRHSSICCQARLPCCCSGSCAICLKSIAQKRIILIVHSQSRARAKQQHGQRVACELIAARFQVCCHATIAPSSTNNSCCQPQNTSCQHQPGHLQDRTIASHDRAGATKVQRSHDTLLGHLAQANKGVGALYCGEEITVTEAKPHRLLDELYV